MVLCSAPEGCERLASSQENTRNAQNTPLQVGGAISHIGLMVQYHIFWDLEKDFFIVFVIKPPKHFLIRIEFTNDL